LPAQIYGYAVSMKISGLRWRDQILRRPHHKIGAYVEAFYVLNSLGS
jgi:hypothetical protein